MNSDILACDNLNLIAIRFKLYLIVGNNTVMWNLRCTLTNKTYSNNQEFK